jgi:hypothetical protein
MKRSLTTILLNTGILILFAATLSSCTKDRYNTTPTQPVGYQNIFDDNFDYDANNWSFSDHNNSAFVDVNGGVLNYTYTPSADGTNTVAVNTGLNTAYDFLIQTSIASDNAMGLAFGVSNYDYGYSFFIDDQGYYAVYKEGNSNTPVTTLVDWTYNAAIKTGWNNIELEQVNGYWVGYANGSQIFQIPAQSFGGSKIGFIVLDGTHGQADYLTVQW